MNGAGKLHSLADEGSTDDLGVESDPMASSPTAEPDPAPPEVLELVAACIRFVASKYGVALDGTPDTLSLLDQYVRDAREAVQSRGEALEVVAPAVGVYLGELLRQTFGGAWESAGSHDQWRLCFSRVYLACNPIGMAREWITMADADGWNSHLTLDPGERDLVDQRLAAMPPVPEDEFYLPSTQFDVVSVAFETLRAHAEQSGLSDVRFSVDDYD